MYRVSQQMLFSRYVNNMNTSLTDLMDLNIKSQTMKRVNKPSDDPTGMMRILDHRDVIRSLDQYQENVDTAKGWLGRSDDTLQQASTLLTRAKELATQAATGTLSADNREEISYELRSLFDQMIGLSNTEFEGKSIYSGHKTDGNAFEKIMWMTTNDKNLNNNNTFRVEGTSETTVLVQFYDTSDTAAPGDTMALNDPNLGIRYSSDGGDSWKDGTVAFAGGEARLQMPGSGTSVVFNNNSDVRINSHDDENDGRGTWLWLRPSARYLGDDVDSVDVDKMGSGTGVYEAEASGSFPHGNVMVRIDNDSAVDFDEEIEYSFSIDGGLTWKTGNRAYADATASNAVLSIQPGGVLTLNSNGGNTLQPGTQFVIHPRTADINLDISETESVRVNDIGKDLFGGIYQDPDVTISNGGNATLLGSSNAMPMFYDNDGQAGMFLAASNASTTENIFEVMGNLIAFTETNNQTGVQQMLASLEVAHEHLMNRAASVGGRENRLSVADNILSGLELNEKELLSNVEDADVTELMTDLAQKQIIYESVLRSSSMIMQMNLTKFI
ncbi:flagellar hook-associated protein FlgL [Pseudodesulfovibrio senegalensis]|jgi:flagellar hook-associated protein 3 FlgL|uniref:Flagellar hook-associated protein 3 n=1 Tax=Pseudodesulfovibrio senegalensis TaxID=1721087 RepID=A0A6N6N128_9BACT|nr:flagellar hook-associated protein FlgL [Pseudodesulfovibrio senegalensis]KAB1440253.1 flagellar hook-associated protein 3 [Pseudodesulfovibrio senegalensis]